jgi:pimeloyl-ACP methyl ester carboxylesterase
VLAAQDAPTILVGHSYGGAVITQLGTDAPNVVGLVYIAAFVPDQGETMQGLTGAGPAPAGSAAIRPDAAGFLWLDPAGFVQFFAPDVAPVQARVLAAVQKPIAAAALLGAEPFGVPAWKALPSWYLLTQDDQMIPPAAQQFMAGRAGATLATVAASHVPMLSQPEAVANLIMAATAAAPAGVLANTAS